MRGQNCYKGVTSGKELELSPLSEVICQQSLVQIKPWPTHQKIDAGFLKICITPLLVVCSLHLQKIIEFYLCIQMLPVNVSWLHFSWTTLYKYVGLRTHTGKDRQHIQTQTHSAGLRGVRRILQHPAHSQNRPTTRMNKNFFVSAI